jgi:hypothetical protein
LNNVNPSPTLPPVSAPGFLVSLLDYLRRIAAVLNGLNEGRAWPFVAITGTHTSGDNELVILCAPAAPCTVAIPDAKSTQNKMVFVKRTNNTVHTITVDPVAGNIDGAPTSTLTSAYQVRRFFSDGTNYHEM